MAKSKRPNKKNTLSTLAITATALGVLIGQSNDQLPASSVNLQDILNDKVNPRQTELAMPEKTKKINHEVAFSVSKDEIPISTKFISDATKGLEDITVTYKYGGPEYDTKKEREDLKNKHQFLALASAAKEFGNLIPKNYQDLQEKVKNSLTSIGEESNSDGMALERIIIFCGDLTNDLHKMYNQVEDSETIILSGVRFNVRLLMIVIDVQAKGVEDFVDEMLSNEVGTLMAIFQTLFALYELIKNVKTEKNKRIHPKTVKELNSMQQTLRDASGLNLWVLESSKNRLQKLIAEFCAMIEDCSDPEKEYNEIYGKYRKKICSYIGEIKKTNAGNLPDVREIIQAWKEFGCEN